MVVLPVYLQLKHSTFYEAIEKQGQHTFEDIFHEEVNKTQRIVEAGRRILLKKK